MRAGIVKDKDQSRANERGGAGRIERTGKRQLLGLCHISFFFGLPGSEVKFEFRQLCVGWM